MQDDLALFFSAEFPSIKLLPSLQKHPGKTNCAQCSQLVAKIRPEIQSGMTFIFCGNWQNFKQSLPSLQKHLVKASIDGKNPDGNAGWLTLIFMLCQFCLFRSGSKPVKSL